MRSASIAEWLVGRFTSKERAASVVGDLVELQSQKGLLWFWASLIGVVVSLSWRAGLRFIASFLVYGAALLILEMVGMSHLPRDSQHWPPSIRLMLTLDVSFTIGARLWMILMYTGIRYGLQDKVTRLALAWASLATVAIVFWQKPMLLLICLAAGIWMASVSISRTRYRKATLVLLGTVATGWVGDRLMGYVSMFGIHLLLRAGHKNIFPVIACVSLIVFWITVMTCSGLHHKLLGDKPLNKRIEEGVA
jgi:hypothetical protein